MNTNFHNAPHRIWHRRLLRRYGFGFGFVNGRVGGAHFFAIAVFILIRAPLYAAPFVFLALWPVREEWNAAFEATRWLWLWLLLFLSAATFFSRNEFGDAYRRGALVSFPVWIALSRIVAIIVALATEQFVFVIACFWGSDLALQIWRFARRRDFFL